MFPDVPVESYDRTVQLPIPVANLIRLVTILFHSARNWTVYEVNRTTWSEDIIPI